ncbi:hypothetical protein CAP39_01540 [Sphingomonas sp. IBVSS1]|nr:hypothetical protein CAP39_01540 [Sphingomonas sp. IBVSS1]
MTKHRSTGRQGGEIRGGRVITRIPLGGAEADDAAACEGQFKQVSAVRSLELWIHSSKRCSATFWPWIDKPGKQPKVVPQLHRDLGSFVLDKGHLASRATADARPI